MKLNLTYLFLAALLLGGCAKDALVENPTKSESVLLQLSATRAGSVEFTPATKADEPIPVNVTTGIYLAANGVTPVNFFSPNINYVCTTVGALAPFTGVAPISLTLGENYDIYAYAPFKTGVTATSIPVTSADDVMWTDKVSIVGVTKDKCTAALAFKRRAAQVALTVDFASDFPADKKAFTEASASKIDVTGFYSTDNGTLNLLTGELTPTGTATATKSATTTLADGTLKLPKTQFLLPTTGGLKLSIVVTHYGKQYKGEFTAVAGTSYNYTIKVSSTSTPLGVTGTLAPWTEVTGNISASE